ncbi:uncharacterized protein LOC117648256 [Thrips palmi]|uniref:Uncharacterized protein LOC117648256 n=1 Tax=Thrips palmi TaxID=161013 RepID=A0A6P8ZCN4_THRPL|nr:uncharacterized protein LOC117648256 [Thrips palmi]XP_034246562.1 uncharacterized protein LOC117648256 [Thrips palmi]
MIAKLLALVAFVLLANSTSTQYRKGRPGSRRTILVPRVLYMEHCKDKRQHSLIVHNYSSLVDGRGVVYLNAAMEFQRTAKALTTMKVVLHRCREAVSSNTCEYFVTWPFTAAICNMITTKGMMWSGFMSAFRPDFKCPITKGLYLLENATVDVSLGEAMSHINIAGNVWRAEVNLMDEKKELFTCLNTAVLINRVNIKD